MKRVNTQDAKTRLSALLASVERTGKPVLICRNGRPVAELRPVGRTVDPLVLHAEIARGVEIRYDPTEPLDPGDWPDPEDSTGQAGP